MSNGAPGTSTKSSHEKSSHSLAPKDPRQEIIEEAFTKKGLTSIDKEAILSAMEDLDQGSLRVCLKPSGAPDQADEGSRGFTPWVVNEWVKKSILLYFRIQSNSSIHAQDLSFWDKIPPKSWSGKEGVRVVPPGVVRFGACVRPGCIVMPSFVNIGAFVDEGTMVDTWATVGSCAQIGKQVHLSGGVGIGGVLEPLQARPVIIEDHAFIGSRCIVVEGAHIGEGAVLGAGVTITGSSKIVDTQSGEIFTGYVPKNSVVIPGAMEKKFPAGSFQVPCSLILGLRKPSTDHKVSLNQTLRDYAVSV